MGDAVIRLTNKEIASYISKKLNKKEEYKGTDRDFYSEYKSKNEDEYRYVKLCIFEDIEEWFSKKKFYGKALNAPNEILELKFYKLEFRPEEDMLLIFFEILNSWGTNVFYNILSYGKTWALTKEELL